MAKRWRLHETSANIQSEFFFCFILDQENTHRTAIKLKTLGKVYAHTGTNQVSVSLFVWNTCQVGGCICDKQFQPTVIRVLD